MTSCVHSRGGSKPSRPRTVELVSSMGSILTRSRALLPLNGTCGARLVISQGAEDDGARPRLLNPLDPSTWAKRGSARGADACGRHPAVARIDRE